MVLYYYPHNNDTLANFIFLYYFNQNTRTLVVLLQQYIDKLKGHTEPKVRKCARVKGGYFIKFILTVF
jgi:hypothetical protein